MEAAHHVVGIFRAGLAVVLRRRDEIFSRRQAGGEKVGGDGRYDLVAMPFGFAECGPVVAPVVAEARSVTDLGRTPVDEFEELTSIAMNMAKHAASWTGSR